MPAELSFSQNDLGSQAAVKAFERSGFVHVPDFLPVSKIADYAKAVQRISDQRLNSDQSITVGTDRKMMTLPVREPFDDPLLFGGKQLSVFLQQVLGADNLLSCMTCVIASPGAPEQHLHRDYDGLFGTPLDNLSPSFAVNLFVPLVPLNDTHGTTRIWPGSHRVNDIGDAPFVEPVLALGSAMLMDYRVLHQGTENRSQIMRPILCLAFSRDWFLDARHFGRANPLDVDNETLARMRPSDRRLFSRAAFYRNQTGPELE